MRAQPWARDAMRLGIAQKLLLAFLGLTLLLLVVTLGLARWSFERGFLDYSIALEQHRLERIAEQLAQQYVLAGNSWAWVDRDRFDAVLSLHRPTGPAAPASEQRAGPALGRLPPRPGWLGPPPSPRPPDQPPSQPRRPWLQRPPPLFPPGNPVARPTGPPTALYDRSGRRLAGPPLSADAAVETAPSAWGRRGGRRGTGASDLASGPGPSTATAADAAAAARTLAAPASRPATDPDAGPRSGQGRIAQRTAERLRVPIRVDDVRVGELVSRVPPRAFETPQATAFARQQAQASLAIGAVALLMAVLVSLLLARALLAPLRRVISAVARLGAGDFGVRLNERRSDELGQLMLGIDQLTQALDANRSARQRWLADLSHELRTPVTILAGEIELLGDGLRPFDADQVRSLEQEVNRLKHLIDDLYTLSLSDVGGLRYRFAPVDLRDALNAAVDAARQRAEDQGLAVELARMPAVWVSADQMRLGQLLANLLENAIAYTDAPGRIRLSADVAADRVLISVEDTPPQPTPAEREQLFEPLYRADGSRSRRRAGAGLGLAICKNIVEGHQGRIRALPSTLGGLCIQVELPRLPGTGR